MDNTQFPKADEEYTASPFNKQGYMYCSDYKANDWGELH